MKYKGYSATIAFSNEDAVFYGKVHGINDLVSFEGTSVSELNQAFEDSVDDYLASCEKLGKEAEKEYKGQFNVRVGVALHKTIAFKAAQKNISLNKYVENALLKMVNEDE